MKLLLQSILFVFLCPAVYSQITITSATLPEVGDVLQYDVFTNYEDTLAYRSTGENQYWQFDSFDIQGQLDEDYLDINQTSYADTFPEANMLIDLSGFQGAAIRKEDSIQITGVVISDLLGFDFELISKFDSPYLYRKTPINYGDVIEDAFLFSVQFDSDLIPGLDTIEIPVPGATLDSIRVRYINYQSQEATGWGTVNIMGEETDVLQITQVDTTDVLFEVGLTVFGFFIWFDASEFFDFSDFNFNLNQTTYKFLSADAKESLVEFTETARTDTSGQRQLVVNGRLKAENLGHRDYTINRQSLMIAPNPSDGTFRLKVEDGSTRSMEVFIYDGQGRVVKRIGDYISGQAIQMLDHGSGVYYLLAKSENGYHTGKLVVK